MAPAARAPRAKRFYKAEAGTDEANFGRLHQYTTADAALGYTWSKFMAEIFVANLWDERGEVSKFAECGACTRTYIYPITPRTIGVRVGAKF